MSQAATNQILPSFTNGDCKGIITTSRGQKVNVFCFTGTVITYENSTRVLWLRGEDGKERDFRIGEDLQFSTLPGHIVTVTQADYDAGEYRPILLIRAHNCDRNYWAPTAGSYSHLAMLGVYGNASFATRLFYTALGMAAFCSVIGIPLVLLPMIVIDGKRCKAALSEVEAQTRLIAAA